MTPEGVAATFAVRYRTLEVQDLHLKEMVMNKLFPSVKIEVFCGTFFWQSLLNWCGKVGFGSWKREIIG